MIIFTILNSTLLLSGCDKPVCVDCEPDPDYEPSCIMYAPCGATVYSGQSTRIQREPWPVTYAWVRPSDLRSPDLWVWQGPVYTREYPPVPQEGGDWVFMARSGSPGREIPCKVDEPFQSLHDSYEACCLPPPDWDGFDPETMTWFVVDDGVEPVDWDAPNPTPADGDVCPV